MFVSDSLLVDFVTFVVAILTTLLVYWKWSFQYWRRHNLPYLEPQIPFGNLADALTGREYLGISLKKIYDEMKSRGWKHGGFYVFNRPNYMPLDLEIVKHVVIKDFGYFSDRDQFVNEDMPLQAHLINLRGEAWRNLRTKLSPTFTSGKMKMMFNIMAAFQDDLVQRVEKDRLSGKPIDIKEVTSCFTTNIVGSSAFGLDFKALEDENCIVRLMGKAIFDVSHFRIFMQSFVVSFPRIAKILDYFQIGSGGGAAFIASIIEKTVEHREKNNESRNDFLQLLMNLKNNPPKDHGDHDGKPLTMDEIASQSFLFFAAGFETASTLMTFALYEMSRNQDIQDKVRKEIIDVLSKHDNKVTYDSVQDIKYMNQVIDETLRIYQPVGFLNRICVKDYKVPNEDVVIKKGTPVFVPLLGIHHDAEYYPDPEKFDPERFSDENKKSRHPYAHMPFGEGPRICIGMRFGLLQAKVGLIALLKNYKFTVNKRTKEPITFRPNSFVLTTVGDMWLNAEKL